MKRGEWGVRDGILGLVIVMTLVSACTVTSTSLPATETESSTRERPTALLAALTPTPRLYPTYTSRPPRATTTEAPATDIAATSTMTNSLALRKPTTDELKSYLQLAFPVDFYGIDDSANIIYADVSGDGQDDLIVDNFLEVIVLIWSGHTYLQPYRLHYSYWKYDPGSTIKLEDWTNDGTPEVIFDYRGDTGGTGIVTRWWKRHVIHCGEFGCRLVFETDMGSETDDYNLGGVSISNVSVRVNANLAREPIVRKSSERFSVFCCWLMENESRDFPFTSLNVFTSTVSQYIWNGSVFTLTSEQVASLPVAIDGSSVLTATSSAGISAFVVAESNNAADSLNDQCQLKVADQPTGPVFGCKRNFTSLSWRDITGDGREDLMVVALSGAYDLALSSKPLSEKGCAHQRLLLYDIAAPAPREIANVTGCVVRSDLFGVRLEDFDQDGQTEIVAAKTPYTEEICRDNLIGSCWYQLAHTPAIEIYKWNGSHFVFWDDVPGQP